MLKWTKAAVAKRAEIVKKTVAAAFPNPPIPLDHKDSYTLLVAVILSAQCTDERVNKVTAELFKVADTPQKMVALGFAKIRALIKSCGLPDAKAKGLYEGAKIILEKFGGAVPGTREELESLPAVGSKTASVVLSHGFGVPAMPVDTHIFRCSHRWGLSKGKTPDAVSADLQKLYPPASWEKLHLRIIYYGRKFCTARGCDGTSCPLCGRIMAS